ncbi:PREDICTED: organic cation transporter-like protein [Papilio polytes]|uniref:organic cation transporter-like protein n=1 Tax=Papilio polytes TaxID=76194 RepID=UPI0006768C79|nr:PREDICTED: organic cation transporter-like protein [Papilio polytes]
MSTEDAIENIIGRFGLYQTWVLFLIAIGRVPADFQLTNVVYILPKVDYVCLDEGASNMTNYCPCKNPQYETSTIVESVVTTWHLICGSSYLASLAQSVLQIGILTGSLLYGYLSDRYGRKTTILMALTSDVVFVVASALVPDFWMFLVLRFLIGTSVGGTLICSYTLMVELSGKSFRPYLPGLTQIAYATVSIVHPIIAYYIREWRYLQLVTSVPCVFVISYNWLMLESPRWLITVGKKEEAIDVLTKIAKRNKRPTDNIASIIYAAEEHKTKKEEPKYGSYLDLFSTPKMKMYSLIIACVWFCCGNTFYGINQYIGRLQGNFYLNIFLFGVFHIPPLFFNVLVSLYIKRKIGVIGSFTMSAIALIIFIYIPSDLESISLAFAILGHIGSNMAFGQMYLFTSEVFPTVVRNSALGFASMFSRFGGFAAPFVVNIGIEWMSVAIFSGVTLVAAFFCFFLPDTKDKVLLNTIEQAEKSTDEK